MRVIQAIAANKIDLLLLLVMLVLTSSVLIRR